MKLFLFIAYTIINRKRVSLNFETVKLILLKGKQLLPVHHPGKAVMILMK